MNTETVLVTGASSGIGKELARQFAKNGHPLVIVAPIEEELDLIAEEFTSQYNVPVRVVAKDLFFEGSPEEIFDELQNEGIEVDILVNNAGLGQHGNFWEIPIEKDLEMIRVNVEAVVRMTKLFLTPMISRGRGRILNTASVAGFEPGPTVGIYHATKAFVLSFSEALATELKDTGVGLTILCPGPVDTDFFPKAEMVDTKVFQKGNVMAPQEVAEAAYKALMAGERLIVPGGINKAMVFGRRFLPESMQAKMNEQMYADVPVEDRKRERGDVETKVAAKQNS